MTRTDYIKLAKEYLDDLEGALKVAAEHGFLGLDYTEEKLAAFKNLVLHLDEEELNELDKTAAMTLDAMEKLAIWHAIAGPAAGIGARAFGALSKILGAGGARAGARAAQLAEYAARPTQQFTQFLTARGRSPEFITKAWREYQRAGGPLAYLRQRAIQRVGPQRFERAVFEMPAPAAAAAVEPLILPAVGVGRARAAGRIAQPAVEATVPAAAPAAAQKRPRWWDPIVTGGKWGLGFAVLQRLFAPEPHPEIRYLGQ